jgi:hypothetical protein
MLELHSHAFVISAKSAAPPSFLPHVSLLLPSRFLLIQVWHDLFQVPGLHRKAIAYSTSVSSESVVGNEHGVVTRFAVSMTRNQRV